VILFLTLMLQTRTKLITLRTASTGNWNVHLINTILYFLGHFNTKVGKEGIFKLTIRNESLHEISNDNRAIVVNFATSKNQSYV
jgi:hypothetical protein